VVDSYTHSDKRTGAKNDETTDTKNVDENQNVDAMRTWTKLRMWTTCSNRGIPSRLIEMLNRNSGVNRNS
jgi:hypothetical protein